MKPRKSVLDVDRPSPLRVVLVEDSAIYRAGLVAQLEAEGVEVLAAVADAQSLIAAIEERPPDVALLDIRLPPDYGDEGLALAREIRAHRPEIGLVFLTGHHEPPEPYGLDFASTGGLGYLEKTEVDRGEVDLVDCIRRVAADGCVISPATRRELDVRSWMRGSIDALTPREREVLGLLAEGFANQGIQQHLGLAKDTVEKHLTQIYRKLGLTSVGRSDRALAILLYIDAMGSGWRGMDDPGHRH